MRIFDWNTLSVTEQKQALARPPMKDDAAIASSVSQILLDVKAHGDKALRELSQKFDGALLADFRVPEAEIAAAIAALPKDLRAAIDRAKANIETFHAAEKPKDISLETMPGVVCELQWRPLENVGLYIPAGTAPLFSTVLMLAIPAMLAGCKRKILCSPPQKGGKVNPSVLAVAAICGIEEIYAIGGAQAIAAMAYGTQTVPKADKIFGPGNAYVTLAKQMVSQDADGAAIDMPAGPSEVMVVADANANPAWVAADLLAQAEHDVMAQAVLVTTDAALISRVEAEIKTQLGKLNRREIATQSLINGRIILAQDTEAALAISNAYAPEHLILHYEDAESLVPRVQHAGSVFVGAFTPESAGDYASGTNHVLPTYGYARSYNGVNLLSFMKSMTVQKISQAGLKALGPAIMAMADAEGLDAHAASVRLRLETK